MGTDFSLIFVKGGGLPLEAATAAAASVKPLTHDNPQGATRWGKNRLYDLCDRNRGSWWADAATLKMGHLGDDMSGGTETIDAGCLASYAIRKVR